MKLLLVEDDAAMADHVTRALRERGHTVDHEAVSGEHVLAMAVAGYDVLIVDRMLPGMDGLTLVKRMRAAAIKTPVLFLTAVGGIDDRVEGLEAGGDDYLVKPFALSELLARLNALARRPPPSDAETSLAVGDLKMDLLSRAVTRAGRAIDLQPQEFKLLQYLMRNAGRVVTRTMLLENVWEFSFDPRTTVVETHISRLRGKVEQAGEKPLIHTIRGAGYCLRADS